MTTAHFVCLLPAILWHCFQLKSKPGGDISVSTASNMANGQLDLIGAQDITARSDVITVKTSGDVIISTV